MEILNKNFQLGAFLLFFLSCQHHEQKGLQPSPSFSLIEYRREAMKVSEVKINHSVPFLMGRKDFIKVFGREDSIVKAPLGLNTSFVLLDTLPTTCQYLCKGRSIFLEKGEYIYPILIDLASTPVTLSADTVEFSINTTGLDILRDFPMSVQLRKGNDGNAFGGTVSIDATGANKGNQMWFLIFQGDMLAKIVFYVHPERPFINNLFGIRKELNSKK